MRLPPAVRDEIKAVEVLGWKPRRYVGGHVQLEHPDFGRVTFPGSPGSHRWINYQRREIAERMGISMAELNERLGASHRSQPAEVRKARRRRERVFRPIAITTGKVSPERESKPVKAADVND